MTQIIKEIIVVEGKTDTLKLKSLFSNIKTFETNGQSIDQKKINLLKIINQESGIICFLDPDGPGKLIRQKIINFIPNCKHAFIEKKDIPKNSKKFGLAEANNEAIIQALMDVVTFDNSHQSISWIEYLNLNLSNKAIRLVVCNKLKINYYNHKQLFKIFNYMHKNYEDIDSILK